MTNDDGTSGLASAEEPIQISVVVPTFNDHERLGLCLDALEGQDLPRRQFEVIVVDNNSSPPVSIPATSRARLLRHPAPGSYSARNAGIDAARASVIAFTDADCIPDHRWLSTIDAWFAAHPDAGMVAGAIDVIAVEPGKRSPAEVFEAVHAFPQERYVADRRFGATANLAVRATVFDAVGGFNDELRSSGDVEFGIRATSHGIVLGYEDRARVAHPARSSLGELISKQRRTMAGTRDLAALRGDPFPYPIAGTIRRLLPPMPTLVRAARDRRIGTRRDRLVYGYALVVMHYARAVTKLRLAMGAGSPRS